MSTIKDYLKYYKNTTFEEYKFNELDNLLFSEISYINWDGIVSKFNSKIKLKDAISIYLENNKERNGNKLSPFMKSNIENLKAIENCTRYNNCYLSNYRNEVDDNKQFGAICIYLNSREIYISFKGTDSTLIGWKENLSLSYIFPTLSQKAAIDYLNEVASLKNNTIYVGGHSKGGNLAMTAAMYCNKRIKKRIKTIFNNDGPGFKDSEYNSKEYNDMITKLKMFLPEESVVGILLNNTDNYTVVKSIANGVKQHDCNSWECFGSFLIRGTLSESSKKIKAKITRLLEKYDDEKKKELIVNFFDILKEANITSFKNISSVDWNQVIEIIKGLKNLDVQSKELYINLFKDLLLREQKDMDVKKIK